MKTKFQIRRSVQILLVLIFISFIFSCRSANKNTNTSGDDLKGNISISGAFALYPMTVRWAEEFQKQYPQVQIDISAGGAGKGMADVLSGMVDLAMFSREVSTQEEEKGAWKIAVAKDAVFPTINSDNPAMDQVLKKGLTKEQFRQLFTGEDQKSWNQFEGISNPDKINVYTRSDACGAAAMWASFFNKEQEDLRGTGVFGDPGMADAVKKDKNGVGYNNLIYVYDMKTNKPVEGLKLIPVDLNDNRVIDPEENFYNTMDDAMEAIQLGTYPSPPARDLYLISKGYPTNTLVKTFLGFILTEGQKFVSEGGYIKLDENKLHLEKARLSTP
jgi:phosphate transport system substrate-binding protein